MIELSNLSKRFGRNQAVQPFDLEIPRGTMFGLLGHNGSGKSTVIGMMLGQVFPTTGEVTINGYDLHEDRHRALARVGAIFETPAFYDYLSGLTNLRILCDYSARPSPARMAEVIGFVGLENRIRDRVRTYSHGMRQRLALAQALLPDPELLILDEPTDGLDPEGLHEMRQMILRLNQEWGLTILLASHLLSEVEHLCSHVAVLRQGALVYAGPWRAGSETGGQVRVEVDPDRQSAAETGLVEAGLVTRVHRFGPGAPGGRAHNGRNRFVAGRPGIPRPRPGTDRTHPRRFLPGSHPLGHVGR